MTRRPRSLRLADYLRHIIDAVGRVRSYTAGLTEDDFLRSPLIQDAVIRNLEVVGEACRNVLQHHGEFAAAHDEVPWRSPYEMRNALTHGYFNVDLIQTWATVRRDLPAIEVQVQALLLGLDRSLPTDDGVT
jgi:uncharacterized protein with HEPN domain